MNLSAYPILYLYDDYLPELRGEKVRYKIPLDSAYLV